MVCDGGGELALRPVRLAGRLGVLALVPAVATLLAGLACGAPVSARLGATHPSTPNIVFILADDLGYGDLSCQNPATRIRTPRLDRLASQGMRFTDAHAPSALCTPSRYSILTGQNCWRSRLKAGVLNMWDEPLIGAERLTVAGLLRNAGYRTACFGKWHLGLAWPFFGAVPSGFDTNVKSGAIDWARRIGGGPVDCGFDYYFGVNIANEPPYAFIENDHVVGMPTMDYPTVTGQQGHWAGPGVSGWDWSQSLPTITSNTVRWIQTVGATASQPFFLYASLVGPHQPVLPAPAFQNTSQAGPYGDYVQEIDWAVGALLDALEATGAATNTLVIFTSDNGPDEYAYQRLEQYQHASMGQLRGVKSDIWEGGHRVPFLARWPGQISAGATNQQTICLVDFMRTVADLVEAPLPADAAQDSVSFLPALLGNSMISATNRLLVLESGIGQFGLRSQNWMYIDSSTGDGHNPELEPLWFAQSRKYVSVTNVPALLYDLEADPGQRLNLLNQDPELARVLQAQLLLRRPSSTWSGGVSGDWSAAANWKPAGVPAGADIIYNNVPGLANLTQTIGASLSINSIILDRSISNNVQIRALAGASLTIAGGIDLSMASANLSIQAPLVLDQSQLWSVGFGHQLQLRAPLALQSYGLTLCGRGDIILSNRISGSGELRIRSSGATVLGNTNDFSGGVELSGGGLLVAQTPGALGTGLLSIPNNSTLAIAPGVTLTNAAVIQGHGMDSGTNLSGALMVRSNGVGSFSGPIQLTGPTGLRASAAGSILMIAGTISGAGDVTILAGAGTTVFATNQFYRGRTVIQGKLKLDGGPDPLPGDTELLLANGNGAQLDLNGHHQTVASLAGGGTLGGTILLGGATLTVAAADTEVFDGSISGKGDLEKLGPGALILGGSNVFGGTARIRSGWLVVSGSLVNAQVTVEGATLTGSGSIGGNVNIGSAGGLSLPIYPGPLVVSNRLVLSQASTTVVQLDAAQGKSGGIRGLTSVSYGGSLWVANLSPAAPFTNGQSFRVFSSLTATGAFSQIQPEPGLGLQWRFDSAKGTLTVMAQPRLQAMLLDRNRASISWPGRGFRLQALTNICGLASTNQWVDCPAAWVSPLPLPIDPKQTSVFFRLISP